MKLTRQVMRVFKRELKEHGPETALSNVLLLKAQTDAKDATGSKIKIVVKSALKRGAAILLAFLCVSCTTLPDGTRGPNLFAIRTSAALATDIALASLPRSERAEVQAYLPALASAVHSLAGGTAPTPAQVDAILASWTDRPLPVVRIAASAVGAIYATYYPSIKGNAAQALAVLGAIADGVALSGGFVAGDSRTLHGVENVGDHFAVGKGLVLDPVDQAVGIAFEVERAAVSHLRAAEDQAAHHEGALPFVESDASGHAGTLGSIAARLQASFTQPGPLRPRPEEDINEDEDCPLPEPRA